MYITMQEVDTLYDCTTSTTLPAFCVMRINSTAPHVEGHRERGVFEEERLCRSVFNSSGGVKSRGMGNDEHPFIVRPLSAEHPLNSSAVHQNRSVW